MESIITRMRVTITGMVLLDLALFVFDAYLYWRFVI